MDLIENDYLVIPTHTKMSNSDATLVSKNVIDILSKKK